MQQEQKKISKPIVLIVLDGWGVYQEYPGNAVKLANTPVFDSLISEYPTTTLRASDEAVGLPWGEAGNSEVGHLGLGLGRILYQLLPRINKDISDHSFYKNEVLLGAINHAKANNSKLHFVGLASNGGVHSSIDHLFALLVMAKQNNLKKVYVHVILDGRDTAPNAGLNQIKGIGYTSEEYEIGEIATICGRFYAMDRNNNWDRTEKAYLALTEGKGQEGVDPVKIIEKSYKKRIYDEEFLPTVIKKSGKANGKIGDNDAVVFYNFRPDRARQLTKAFVEPDFDKFERPKFLQNLYFVTFSEYEKSLPVKVAFPPYVIKNSLGEVLSKKGLNQLRIAETEKYAHVTYFFNGGIEKAYAGEDRVLVPSPAVSSYDLQPEMSAPEVCKKLIEAIASDKYDFILVNFANPDMVGHTGNLQAAIRAIETVDKCVGRVVKNILLKSGTLFIVADHGNAEVMYNMQTGQIDKEHTSNPVPFIFVNKELAGLNIGWQDVANNDLTLVKPHGVLADVAPTILKVMKIEKPKQMGGISLI